MALATRTSKRVRADHNSIRTNAKAELPASVQTILVNTTDLDIIKISLLTEILKELKIANSR